MSSTEVTIPGAVHADVAAREKPSPAAILDRPAVWALCLSLLLAGAIFRIVSTYHVFNHTIDEPSHIACGIEWWEKGTYTIETKHTPLARICVALGPYLAGVRGTGATNWRDTYPILSANGHYWRNLTLGRIGVLPFFVILTLVVFLWTKRLFGTPMGLLAVAVFTQIPTILAHAGVATTDFPFTAMFCFALYAFTLWLYQPRWQTAAIFGVTTGLALTAKLSTVVFLPACAVPVLAMYVAAGRKWRGLLRSFGIAILCAFLATWAVYRFSHAPLAQVTKLPEHVAGKIFGPTSRATGFVHQLTSHIPVPAPELIDGVRSLRNQNSEGTKGYLLGHLKQGGWWYFFFVAMAVKTPLAVLLLAALGSIFVVRKYLRTREDWETPVPLVAAAVLMIVTMPSGLDNGVRYVLPVFAFLSILAAVGLAELWKRRKQQFASRAVALGLFAWLAISSALAHPDYLSYFNELGGHDPSRIIVVGDFDWGQDLTRLATYLREHNVSHVSIAYDGFYVPQSLGLPETDIITLNCGVKPSGWVAMEVRRARLHPECYPWLAQQHKLATVGKTMWVYYVQP